MSISAVKSLIQKWEKVRPGQYWKMTFTDTYLKLTEVKPFPYDSNTLVSYQAYIKSQNVPAGTPNVRKFNVGTLEISALLKSARHVTLIDEELFVEETPWPFDEPQGCTIQ